MCFLPTGILTCHVRSQDASCTSEKMLNKQILVEAQEVATSSMNLEAQGKYQEAKMGLEKVLYIQTRVLGEEHALVAASLNHLGRVLLVLGIFSEAKRVHTRA